MNSDKSAQIPHSVDSHQSSHSPEGQCIHLADFFQRLRPADGDAIANVVPRLRQECERLAKCSDERTALRLELFSLLGMDDPNALYAEAGVQSAMGFPLELKRRIGQRLLPSVPDLDRLDDRVSSILNQPDDHRWIAAVPDADWLHLAATLELDRAGTVEGSRAAAALLDAARLLSTRIAGAGIDRELLRSEPSLHRHESPFLAQNAEFLDLHRLALEQGQLPAPEAACHLDVLLEQCREVIARIRRHSLESGASVRLTYLLARLEQLIERFELLLDVLFNSARGEPAVRLFKTLAHALNTRNEVFGFIGRNVNLLARNVTDNASRHGEHYIAGDRSAWFAMFLAAAGGGIIIAAKAALKLRLSLLHLPPLTEGLVYGLNYGLGFALIHMLGGVVATKQPAMTATTLAAGLENARSRELGKLAELVRDVVRTQYIAILGNVLLAIPVAIVIAWAWPQLFATPIVDATKATRLLEELHPFASGALWFAAVAGVGLFLSGLVAGYYDNQMRYLLLAERIVRHPWLEWLAPSRRARLCRYLDEHYGALLGNLFFGMFLGLAGSVGQLTGLPIDIRHVAFASANVGTALTLFDFDLPSAVLVWALLGVACIGLINLLVSFSLALYVAMRSRQQNLALLPGLLSHVLRLFWGRPLSFFLPQRTHSQDNV